VRLDREQQDEKMPPNESTTEKKVLGVTLGDIVKIALTGIISITIAYMVFQWNSKKPTVTWEILNSASHTLGNKNIGIYDIFISNNGIKEAEDLECTVKTFLTTKIDDVQVYPGNVRYTKTSTSEAFSLHMPFLGENESVRLTVLVSTEAAIGQIPNPTVPIVNLRGKGIKFGEKEQTKYQENKSFDFYEYMIAHQLPILLMVILIPYLILSRMKDRKIIVRLESGIVELQKTIKEIKTSVKKIETDKGKSTPR
jgi:hypothetical protein